MRRVRRGIRCVALQILFLMCGERVTMRKAARGAGEILLGNSAAILRQVLRPPSVIRTTQPQRSIFQAVAHQLPRQDSEDDQGQQTTAAAKAGAIWTTGTFPDRGLPPPPRERRAATAQTPGLHHDLQDLWCSGRCLSLILQVPSTPSTPCPAVLLICQGSSTQSPQQHVPLPMPMAHNPNMPCGILSKD